MASHKNKSSYHMTIARQAHQRALAFQQCADAVAEAEQHLAELLENIDREAKEKLQALPKKVDKPKNVEDPTIRNCKSCGEEMLAVTRQNAEMLAKIWTSEWQWQLISIRNRSQKHETCCACCEREGKDHHSNFCIRASEYGRARRKHHA